MCKSAVVAGHVCLDVIPDIDHQIDLTPGHLYEVGAAAMATGGAVSNTGVAMQILGVPVQLMAMVGKDSFGDTIARIFEGYKPGLSQALKRSEQVATSYSVVINIPGIDRIFLHCPGANAAFSSDDIDYDTVAKAALFHFGYSSLMSGMYADEGAELLNLYRKVKELGVTTSLDPAQPDPNGPAGKENWLKIFEKTLPYVDIFMPSSDELLYMIWRERYGIGDELCPADVSILGKRLIDMGVAIAAIKMGHRGMYVRTASAERLRKMGAGCPEDVEAWANREAWFPIMKVEHVVGATGSGDTTIAGFLAAILRNESFDRAGAMACAVGACNVEAASALGGIRTWEETTARLDAGWERTHLDIAEPGWTEQPNHIWHGPAR